MKALPLNELSHLLCYQYHGTLLFIDPKITLGEIRDRCPTFFSASSRREQRRVYKGHIIVKSIGQLGPDRTAIYAFDMRTGDTYCVCPELPLLRQPADFINAKLQEPLKLGYFYHEVEVTVPAKVKVFICRDLDGKVTAASVAEFEQIGSERQENNPGDTFTTAAWNAAIAQVYEKARTGELKSVH